MVTYTAMALYPCWGDVDMFPLLIVGFLAVVGSKNGSYGVAANRLLDPSVAYYKPSPFTFVPRIAQPSAYSGDTFDFIFQIKGEVLPDLVFLHLGERRIPMMQVDGLWKASAMSLLTGLIFILRLMVGHRSFFLLMCWSEAHSLI